MEPETTKMTENELDLIRSAFGAFYEALSKVEKLSDYYGHEFSQDLYSTVVHLGQILNTDLTQRM